MYLSISSGEDDWAAIKSDADTEESVPLEAATEDTDGGLLSVSATTLAEPATWRTSVVNSET